MIREINDEYRKYIYSVLKKIFNVNYTIDSPFANWYIYVIEEKIVGFINFDIIYEKAELDYIFVEEKYRNSGIATKLLEAMELKLKKNKVAEITLEVNCNNEKAISLYEKAGYKKVAIRKNYYKNEDGILMMKSW